MLGCPFDLPIAHLGIFLIVVPHQGRSVRKILGKVIKAVMKPRRAVFPGRIVMRGNDAIGLCGIRFGDIVRKFYVIHFLLL